MLILRRHGNTGKQPSHAFSAEEETQIVSFIQNYAEANAILLPGRIPGYKHYNMQMLPSSVSKRSVYLQYMKAKGTLTYRLAPETTFYKIWRKYLPHVIITKPMTDLCWKCQHNSAAIVRSLNSTMQNQSTVSDCLM